jgi:hypothetical protein
MESVITLSSGNSSCSATVQSLDNKVDEHRAKSFHKDIRDCNILCFHGIMALSGYTIPIHTANIAQMGKNYSLGRRKAEVYVSSCFNDFNGVIVITYRNLSYFVHLT